MSTDVAEIQWAPRIPKDLIRRLYESDAKGLLDEELVDDIGTRLYLRSESILTASEAAAGRVKCPRCARKGVTTIIGRNGGDKEEIIRCDACGWRVSWREYFKTYQKKQLTRGGAGDYFEEFVNTYPRLKTASEKMIAIDQLIHRWHYNIMGKGGPKAPTRAAGVNFIEGRLHDVIEFLNELSASASPERKETYETWRRILETRPAWHPR